MATDRWTRLSEWHNAWLAADPQERLRLRARLATEHPELLSEADELSAASTQLNDFLETPAFVLAAPELAEREPLLAKDAMVGPYRIVGLIAQGGMGDVYRATDIRLRRDVALKVLATNSPGNLQRVRRFVQEAQVTASLDHPNIVRVYDVGLENDRPYFVAELLDGETLRARLKRGALPVEDARRIAGDLARGLVAAHAAGSVHRDLKPENIFLTRAGVTKILDFGIAKLAEADQPREGVSTFTGIVLGTLGYLAPEQIRGGPIDQRADLFALGAILFEMLTGERAFAREHMVDTLHAILHEPPGSALEQRKDVPPALVTIVRQLLEKAPEARFQSAGDLISSLEEVAADSQSGPTWHRTGASADQALWKRREQGQRIPRRLAWRLVAGSVLAAAVVISGFWIFSRAAAPTPATTPTLAILPFRSLPDSENSQLLELGLADVFISRLNQLPDVRVLPLSATERLRNGDPREAGQKLGADRVLTGTLQREENRIRATVQLLSIAENRPIWSTTFDAEAASAFSIQDVVVARVLQEVAPQLSTTARARLVEPGTHNRDAYESYLRGRAYAGKVTGADFVHAIESFRHAVTIDPNYADAWAALGAAARRLPIVGDAEPGKTFTLAKEAATRALALVPDHAEAQSVLGTVAFWYEWDYPKAEELLRRAIARQPGSVDSHYLLGHLLSNLGRHDEALIMVRRARDLDPEAPLPRSIEGQFLVMARRYDEALAHLDTMVSLEPKWVQGHVMRTYPLLALGRYDEAIREAEIARELEAGIPLPPSVRPRVFGNALRGYALGKSNRRAEAETVLAEILSQARASYVKPVHIALVLHGLGRDDEALAELHRAIEVRDPTVTFLGVDPKYDGLRDSPSFKDVLARANLLEVSNRIRR